MAKKSKRGSKIEKRLVDVSQADPYLKILEYGRHKQGKTRTAGTAPKLVIADINEKGTKSIKLSGAKVFPVRTWLDIPEFYWYLKSGNHDFESVAIDTVTAMQHLCMRHVLGEAEDRDPYREADMPKRQDWGKLGELMKPMILDFRNLDMHVIFIAQERLMTDDDGIIEGHVPDLSPGIRGTLMGAVDVIGRVYQKEVKQVNKKKKKVEKGWETRMLVGPHDNYETGTRLEELSDTRIIRKPNIQELITLMNGDTDGEE